MSRLDNVIESVKSIRRIPKSHRAWIFDDNGNIKDDVLCGDILPFLEELKYYEINVTENNLESILTHAKSEGYTYNFGANVCNDIAWKFIDLKDGSRIAAICIHLYGDARGGFSEWFACKFDYDTQMFELESVTQHKDFGGKYVADINIFSEMYEVYDIDKGDTIGSFYGIEADDVLNDINRKEVS